MDDALLMCSGESFGDLNTDIESLLHREGGLLLLKHLAVNKLHDDEVLVVRLFYPVDCTNIGMIQSCRCFGLLREALQIRRTDRHVFRKELERDGTIELRVLGFVDDTHSPLTKLFENLVVEIFFPDKGIPPRNKEGGS